MNPARLFVLDGPASAPLRNVTLVGVGTSGMSGTHSKPVPTAGWNIRMDFTLDLDPVSTHSSAYVRGIDVRNVNGFLISRIFVLQNNSNSSGLPPDSQRAAIGLNSDPFSPLGGPYYEPRNGTVQQIYAIHEPGGYGPDQVDAAQNVKMTSIYSAGGTPLRLETQASKGRYGATIDGLFAGNIMCRHGNYGVTFSPHAQTNSRVTVVGVVSVDCNEGVKVSGYLEHGLTHRGVFTDSRVQGLVAYGGPGSQITRTGSWVLGYSDRAVAIDPAAHYTVAFSGVTCTGIFRRASDVPC